MSKQPFERPAKFASVVKPRVSPPPSKKPSVTVLDIVPSISPKPVNVGELSLRPLPPNFGVQRTAQPQTATSAVAAATTVTLLYEGFEGLFPEDNSWSVGDSDSNSGLDYWGATSYRAYTGAKSVWSANVGSQDTTVFSDSMSSLSSWTLWNSAGGDWALSSTRYYSSPYSALSPYSNDANSWMYRYADLSGYSSAALTFRIWQSSETGYDYVYVTYYSGGTWNFVDARNGNSGGWQYSSVSIPTTATAVGFYFYSDYSVVMEGTYIDDVKLEGTKTVSNSALHQHDDNMDAYMRRTVDLTGYINATLEFWYLMPSLETCCDYGQLKVNGAEIKRYDTPAISWTKETIDLSSYVGSSITLEWNFHTDASVRREGST